MFIPRKEVIKSGTVWDLDVINQITYQGVPFIPGGNATDELVKITAADTTAGYLRAKVAAGTGIQLTTTNPGANETLTIACTVVDLDVTVKVSANDTTAGFLNGKLVAGTGITFTENNDGGNETLTVTLGSHTHAASDITSGVLGTARLASTGTASATTYLRGDQAWSGLDAGHITAGTVPTARLGTGTANSTTYLAGDQTYKAAVTSVNGATGAVTVAPTVHTHAASDITSGVLGTARLASTGTASATTYLRGDQAWSGLDAGHITAGTVATARLGTGTANSTTFLRGDQTWQTISTGVTGFTPDLLASGGAPWTSTDANARLLATGASSNISISLQPKNAGSLTADRADNTTTGGNLRGQYAVDWQFGNRSQGANRVASGNWSVICGGLNNQAAALGSVAVGGSNNRATGAYAAILNGADNQAPGSRAICIGGVTNQAGSSYALVGNGLANTIGFNGDYMSIVNGTFNQVGNLYSSSYSFIGSGNSCLANGTYNTVLNGSSNSIDGDNCTVIGGTSNYITGSHITVVSGRQNSAAPIGAEYGSIIGKNNFMGHAGGMMFGVDGGTKTVHQRTFSSGSMDLNTSGSAQQADNHLYVQTTNGSAVNMTIGGAALSGTTSIAVPLNSAFFFKIYVVCKRTPTSTADFGAWEITGLAANLSNVVTLYNVNTNLLHRSNAGYLATVVADSTNRTVNIQVTGVAGHTINWSAYAQTIVSATT